MKRIFCRTALAVLLCTVAAEANEENPRPSDSLVQSVSDRELQRLIEEVLARNPKVAAAAAEARAATHKAPRVRSLPDPTVGLTWFVLSPQTRVGPQKANLVVAQRFPWFGKLDLEEQAAVLEAVAAQGRVEALKLELITATRKLYRDLLYEDSEVALIRQERETLERYEELARARYGTGVGLAQEIVKLQAEIALTEARRLQRERVRAHLIVEINTLRDLPGSPQIRRGPGETMYEGPLDPEVLRSRSMALRPEVGTADAEIGAAGKRVELAGQKSRPDLTFGLTYGWVDRRDDAAGRLNPPEGNGDDFLGLSFGTSIPLWSKALQAGNEESFEHQMALSETKRAVVAEIEGGLEDALRRIPLLREQLKLFEKTLLVQAEESLSLAEAAYASGTVGALDLLDAEKTLFGIRRSAERTRADLMIALATLEGVIGAPLGDHNGIF